jgi:branched-subunit amino acid transport protein
MIIFTPFYIYKSGIVTFFDCKISFSYKVLTSFSSLLKAKLKFISYKGLVSLLISSVVDLWLLAYKSLSFA